MKFYHFEQWRKKCAEHMGPIKKIAPTDPEGQKAVSGTTIPHNSENQKKSHMDLMSGYTCMAAGPNGISANSRIKKLKAD